MLRNIEIYFLLFFCYAILGWVMETVLKLITEKKFINRGFLIGPYCPIYGYGVLLITLLLRKYQDDIIATFLFSVLISGILEYFTSYFMERLFHARWWDYSKRRFNINGRVCLETLIPFGIMGCFIVYISNPAILNLLSKIPNIALNIISILLLICYIVDNIVSCNIIFNLKTISKEVKDNTEEISQKVKNIISRRSILYRRLIKAFPLIKPKVNIKEWLTKKEKRINEIKEKIKK